MNSGSSKQSEPVSRQPEILELGIWHGEFYGKASGTLGSEVRSSAASSYIAGISYFVIPARLKPPSETAEYRSVVWIGAVSGEGPHSSAGSLAKDHDPRLLSLTLKVTFAQMGQIIYMLKERVLTEFDFEVVDGESGGSRMVQGWSASYHF